jgi:hypothetical protein
MKYCLIIFIFFSNVLKAQQFELGSWIIVKEEMIDGNEPSITNNFVKYRFLQDGTVQLGLDPIFVFLTTNYSINDSFLKIGNVTYKIEKLTKGSLVMFEDKQDVDPLKFRKYFFINPDIQIDNEKPFFDANINDSVYNATRYRFPQFNGTKDVLLDEFNGVDKDFKLHVSFIINKKGKLIDFQVSETDNNVKKKIISSVSSAFKSLENNWIPATKYGQNINVKVQIIITHSSFNINTPGKNYGMQSFKFEYPFLN